MVRMNIKAKTETKMVEIFNTKHWFFLKMILFLFREGKGRRKGEKHQCVVTSRAPPTGDLAPIPGMCPHWELHQLSFSSQATGSIHWATPARADSFKTLIKTKTVAKSD